MHAHKTGADRPHPQTARRLKESICAVKLSAIGRMGTRPGSAREGIRGLSTAAASGTGERRPQVIDALVAWGPAAAWAVVLFLLSAQGDALSPTVFRHADKLVHLSLYAVLGLALAWGRGRSRSTRSRGFVAVAGVLYGATDEVHQIWVPGRTPSLLDFVADGAGVLLGYALLARAWTGGTETVQRPLSIG